LNKPRDSLGVLHVSQSDLEGGAAKAAYALHRTLLAAGIRSSMVVLRRVTEDDPTVHLVSHEGAWPARRRRLRALARAGRGALPRAVSTFDYNVTQPFDESTLWAVPRDEVDVVCIHRVTRFLTVRQMRRLHDHYGRPLVWLLHDQSALTGGCSFSLTCDGFTRSCGRCPQLLSDDPRDLSHSTWTQKQRLLAPLPITFVGQSRDAVSWVGRSSLFRGCRVERIGHVVNDAVFRPADPVGARERLHIPADAKVIFMGAGDLVFPRKGGRYAVEACVRLAELAPAPIRERLFLLLAGKNGDQLLPDVPFPGRTLGLLHDDLALALCYQAADVFVSPSLADSGPLMVAESLLSGTPVAAFQIGAAADLVRDPDTGRLAPLEDTGALAQALLELLSRTDDGRALRVRRAAAADYTAPRVADAYIALFRSLTESR
jgi:glycosyltransferase involved in cell wall biosynthesis